MNSGYRLAPALLGVAMLAALPAFAQAQEQQRAASMADGFAHLHGFGEGVAAVLAASTPVKRSRVVQGYNGTVTLKSYSQPGLELTTMSGGGTAHPASLAISRSGHALPLGLRIGAPRGAVEEVLGAPAGGEERIVLRRSRGDGCDDPVVLTFRAGVLARVDWTWDSCQD